MTEQPSSHRTPPIDHVNDEQTLSYIISTTENDLGRVCWEIRDSLNRLIFKTCKELTQTEVVESIQDPSGELLWSIHRPIKGWYLALRSPKITNTHGFIALEPRNVTEGKNKMVEFTFRLKSSSFNISPAVDDKPANGIQKPSFSNSSIKRRHASISSLPQSSSHTSSRPTSPEYDCLQQSLESFIIRLRPMEEDAKQRSILNSFTALFLNTNQKIECFIDSTVLLNTNSTTSNNNAIIEHESNRDTILNKLQHPEEDLNRFILFDYQDQNSIFGIQNNGILKLHLKNALKLHLIDDHSHFHHVGFHQAFWVSVCIAYLGFRADQDAYVAAIQGD